jgi:hypothetical protein
MSPPRKSVGQGAPPLFSFPPLKDELQLKLPSRYSTQMGAAYAEKQEKQQPAKLRSKSESVTRQQEEAGSGRKQNNGRSSLSSGIMQLIR